LGMQLWTSVFFMVCVYLVCDGPHDKFLLRYHMPVKVLLMGVHIQLSKIDWESHSVHFPYVLAPVLVVSCTFTSQNMSTYPYDTDLDLYCSLLLSL
jgi:hypothetical protein